MFIVLPSLATPIGLVKTVRTAHINLLGKHNMGFKAQICKLQIYKFVAAKTSKVSVHVQEQILK